MKRQLVSVGVGLVLIGGAGALAACSSSTNTGRADSGANDAGVDSTTVTDSGALDSTLGPDTGQPAETGPSDGSGGDASGACGAYATAECNFYGACEPGTLQGTYGTMANCLSVFTANCELAIGPSGSGFSDSFATACATALTSATAKCSMGPIPRPVPAMGACTIVGAGAGGAPCGLAEQCATDTCTRTGDVCGTCTAPGMMGAECATGSGVTCAVGLQCGSKGTCVPVVAVGSTCDSASRASAPPVRAASWRTAERRAPARPSG